MCVGIHLDITQRTAKNGNAAKRHGKTDVTNNSYQQHETVRSMSFSSTCI